MHRNIILGMLFNLAGACRGSLSLAFDAFVLLLPGGTNTQVGIMEGVAGISGLVATFVGGYLADKCSRRCVLFAAALSAIIATAAVLVTIIVLYTHYIDLTFLGICVAAAASAIATGAGGPAAEACFGDSTPNHARAKLYARKASFRTVGLSLGPLIAVFVFLLRSNTWTKPELVVVMLISAGNSIVNALLMVLFRDVQSTPTAAGGERTESLLPAEQPRSTSTEPVNDSIVPTTAAAGDAAPANAAASSESDPATVTSALDAEVAGWRRSCCGIRRRHVPHLIVANNLLLGLGSGVAYKFLPIFCWKVLHLKPVSTYALTASFQLLATLFNFVIRRAGEAIGPMSACVAFQAVGCVAMGVICFCENVPIVITAMVIRGCMMNCTSGTRGAILNDHIEKASRGRWNMGQQLGQVTWSGSAFAGGWLADHVGFRNAFTVTLGLHSLATLCLCPAMPIVPPERARAAAKEVS